MSTANGDSLNHPQDRKATRHRRNCIDGRSREKIEESGKRERFYDIFEEKMELSEDYRCFKRDTTLINRPLNLVCPLERRQAVASDKGVPTAQSQTPERTRIRRQAAETAKDKICQVTANEEDDRTLLLNGNKASLKIKLHSIFRGAWPKHDRKCRDTHFKPDVNLLVSYWCYPFLIDIWNRSRWKRE